MKRFSNIAVNITKGFFESSYQNFQPCVDLQKLMFDFEEQEADIKQMWIYAPQEKLLQNETYTIIYICYLENNFKEIKKVKAFGLESLVGNVGGYVSLFLGFSVEQLPTFFILLYRKLRSKNNTNDETEHNFPMPEEIPKEYVTTKQYLDDISALRDTLHYLQEKFYRVVSVDSKHCETQC